MYSIIGFKLLSNHEANDMKNVLQYTKFYYYKNIILLVPRPRFTGQKNPIILLTLQWARAIHKHEWARGVFAPPIFKIN